MEPTQVKPIRKRRRWLIVALVLVLVSVCGWWYWPRGDARFVGEWGFASRDGISIDSRQGSLHFQRNGMGFFVTGKGEKSKQFPWRVSGHTLRYGHRSSPLDNTVLRVIATLEILVTGKQTSQGFGDASYRISELSADSLTLREYVRGFRIRLLRIRPGDDRSTTTSR